MKVFTSNRTRFYGTLRYNALAFQIALVLVDLPISVALCIAPHLANRSSERLLTEIRRFVFAESSFDLAVVAVLRVIVCQIALFAIHGAKKSDDNFQYLKLRWEMSSESKFKTISEDFGFEEMPFLLHLKTVHFVVLSVFWITGLYASSKVISLLIIGEKHNQLSPSSYFGLVAMTFLTSAFYSHRIGRMRKSWASQIKLERMAIDFEIKSQEYSFLEEEKDLETHLLENVPLNFMNDRQVFVSVPQEPRFWASLWAIIRNSGPDAGWIGLGFSALTVAAISDSSLPHFIGQAVDSVGVDWDKFKITLIQLLIASLVSAFFASIRSGVLTYVLAAVNKRLRIQLYSSLLKQEIGFFDVTKSGDISSRLNADTSKMSDQIGLNVNILLRSSVQVIGILIFMFSMSWRLTLAAFVSIPSAVVMTNYFGGLVRTLSKDTQEKLADSNALAQETISCISTVKAFAAESFEIQQLEESLKRYLQVMVRTAYIQFGYMFGSTLLPNLVIALVLVYGGRLVTQSHMSRGNLFSFMLYVNTMFSNFNMMATVYTGFAQAMGAAEKVLEWTDRAPLLQQRDNRAPEMINGHISFRNVHFSYPSRPNLPILNGLEFDVFPSEVVALVGGSGGGKSSIVKLIERFYEPASGDILIDEINLADINLDWFHKHCAIVSQEPVLFARSIRENIIYGIDSRDMPSEAEIIEAAKKANAHAFIESLPERYETQVGEKGVQLSGGQRQRIAIARALVRNPSILLLDEATSALDAESEAVVQQALDKIMSEKKRTVIVIAHRLSTVRNADRILVVDSGKIIESGSHLELMAKGSDSIYAKLVQRQMMPSH